MRHKTSHDTLYIVQRIGDHLSYIRDCQKQPCLYTCHGVLGALTSDARLPGEIDLAASQGSRLASRETRCQGECPAMPGCQGEAS